MTQRLGRVLTVFILVCVHASFAKSLLDTELVKKTIAFIYAAGPTGEVDRNRPIGTAFFIAVPIQGRGSYLLLITARHIVEPSWAYCSGADPTKFFIRLNRKQYNPQTQTEGVGYLPVQLRNGAVTSYTVSSDDKVDAAVIRLQWEDYPQKDYDYLPARINVLASPAEIQDLGIGDQIASAGLLPNFSGENRNYPVFKFGHISNIPDEPMFTGCDRGMPALRLERVWFLGANLIGGNSGSPIFFVPFGNSGVGIGGSISRPCIIGVQSTSLEGADYAGMTLIQDVFNIIEAMKLPNANLYRGDLK